jgi:hypothetical protein
MLMLGPATYIFVQALIKPFYTSYYTATLDVATPASILEDFLKAFCYWGTNTFLSLSASAGTAKFNG